MGLQMFLACSKFLGKFEPRCSYKLFLYFKKSVYLKARSKSVSAEILRKKL